MVPRFFLPLATPDLFDTQDRTITSTRPRSLLMRSRRTPRRWRVARIDAISCWLRSIRGPGEAVATGVRPVAAAEIAEFSRGCHLRLSAPGRDKFPRQSSYLTYCTLSANAKTQLDAYAHHLPSIILSGDLVDETAESRHRREEERRRSQNVEAIR